MFDHLSKSLTNPNLHTRRQFLGSIGGGFGALALSHLMLQDELRAQARWVNQI
jgi:hypothetical protein